MYAAKPNTAYDLPKSPDREVADAFPEARGLVVGAVIGVFIWAIIIASIVYFL